jgi:hypothetical protein
MNRPMRQRGSTLLTAMVMVTVVLGMLAGILSYAMAQRNFAANYSRNTDMFTNWNSYLSQPNIYNPIQMATFNNPSSTPPGPADISATSPLRLSNPELFIDVDGDNRADVFIYIRDNQDELPPAADNPLRDNDQNVIVGAICISNTMGPHAGHGLVTDPLQLEGILSYNFAGPQCTQAYCGNGAGNMNN